MTSGSKTVFVLGAGFSADAGYPLQAAMLKSLVEVGIMDLPAAMADTFLDCQTAIFELLRQGFSIADPLKSDDLPSLEDVFTLLDQVVETRGFFAGFDWRTLEKVRDQWQRSLLYLLHIKAEQIPPPARIFFDAVGNLFLQMRIAGGQSEDPVSIISLNWDTLVEDSIYRAIEAAPPRPGADIDYCCYTTPLAGSPHRPSVKQRALGLYNIKVLKIHGSANWLRCPNCQRVFTGLGKKESAAELYAQPANCPECIDRTPSSPPELEPYLVTPTYVKVFNNPHIQTIWHNAYVELAEASEVVFLGYSVPEADYHFRTLLRRAIAADAKIVVVLRDDNDPAKVTDARLLPTLASHRYKRFFHQRAVEFVFTGVKGYFETKFTAAK